jgi:hypothetical protein
MQAPRNERPARQQNVERGGGDAAPAPPRQQHGTNPKDRKHQQPN